MLDLHTLSTVTEGCIAATIFGETADVDPAALTRLEELAKNRAHLTKVTLDGKTYYIRPRLSAPLKSPEEELVEANGLFDPASEVSLRGMVRSVAL